MLEMLLGLALIVALFAFASWRDGKAYDQWEADMRRKGIQWPLEPPTDIPYREIANRVNRDNTKA